MAKKENPAFLEYVYKLNEGTKLTEALELSLKEINDIDIAQLNRLGCCIKLVFLLPCSQNTHD